jgi:hypothetical protein
MGNPDWSVYISQLDSRTARSDLAGKIMTNVLAIFDCQPKIITYAAVNGAGPDHCI